MPPIAEIRILPPLAIARLGSSSEPMVNYDAEIDPADPFARWLVGAPTFIVDASGTIAECVEHPDVEFRDSRGRIRPVAPFFEVWARIGDTLKPLTLAMLEEAGFSAEDVTWTITTANLKLFRRTEDKDDRIAATAGPFTDHRVHVLRGRCPNFLEGEMVPLGHVQYIVPNKDFPEIRLRFTPPKGLLYGSSRTGDHLSGTPVVYDGRRGTWPRFEDPGRPQTTEPGGIFASDDNDISWGFIDDVSDGIVEVELRNGRGSGDQPLRAIARVAVGPPTFAPDSFPVRTIADEIEQALLGPSVAAGNGGRDLDDPIDLTARAEEIVRRAAEGVRLMNTGALNGPPRPETMTTMARQDFRGYRRFYEPIVAPALADTLAVLALHRSILAALKSGTAPWFVDALRRYDEVGDLSDVARRKMPALMRGSDGRHLALTRRQLEIIKSAAALQVSRAEEPPPEPEK